MRTSPASPLIRPDLPPTEADRAQAAAIADVLAELIGDCDAKLASLDTAAANAAHEGALRAAQVIHAKSLQVRRDLEQLQAMEYRLVRRFFDNRGRLAAVTSA